MTTPLTISDVTDDDRRRIIDLYRAKPVLWCPEMKGDREKVTAAWEQIAEFASTPGRTFGTELVKKVWKNTRDHYTRLLKSGLEKSNWQFKSALSFLGTTAPTPKAKKDGDAGPSSPKKKKAVKTPKPKKAASKAKVKVEQPPVEPVKIEQPPVKPVTPSVDPTPSAPLPTPMETGELQIDEHWATPEHSQAGSPAKTTTTELNTLSATVMQEALNAALNAPPTTGDAPIQQLATEIRSLREEFTSFRDEVRSSLSSITAAIFQR